MLDPAASPASAFTLRQGEVLAHALAMLVEGGEKALTTAALARAASCSKESLYKWFGDRKGLLEAVVSYQAAKVRTPQPDARGVSRAGLAEALATFAGDLLAVLASDVSLALNRLAIGQAGGSDAALGRIVLERGRRTIERRALSLLEQGRRERILVFDDAQEAYRTLYGLIVRDSHVRLLLGDGENRPDNQLDERSVGVAIDQFFRLFGREGI